MLKATFLLFTVYFIAIYGSKNYKRPGYPDYVYEEDLSGWLKLHEEPATWEEAVKICKSEGAYLTTSQFNEADAAISKLIKNSNKTIDFVYLGSRTMSAPTPMMEVENEVKAQVPYKVEHCTILSAADGTQKAADCNDKFAFTCYANQDDADCDVYEWGQDREGYPGYNRCSNVTGWIKINPGPADFEEAKETCESEGGKLIDPTDPKFKDVIEKMMKANNTDENPLKVFSKTKITHPHGGFVKVNGKTKFVSKLTPFCSIVHANGTKESPVDCDQKFGFICYAPYVYEYDCGFGDYQAYSEIERCYKMFTIGKTWKEARAQCQEEGGDLAIIKNEKEAETLQDLYANQTNVKFEAYNPWEMFVGIHEVNGSWVTVNDQSLEEAGYNVWGRGKPGNKLSDIPAEIKGARQTCGGINMQGNYVDAWCDLKQAYVCEKKPIKVRRAYSPVPFTDPFSAPGLSNSMMIPQLRL